MCANTVRQLSTCQGSWEVKSGNGPPGTKSSTVVRVAIEELKADGVFRGPDTLK